MSVSAAKRDEAFKPISLINEPVVLRFPSKRLLAFNSMPKTKKGRQHQLATFFFIKVI